MNVALSTLFVVILLFPGIFFSRFYYSGQFSKQYFRSSFQDLLIFTIIPTLLLHGIWVLIVSCLSNIEWLSVRKIDWSIILSLVSGIKDQASVEVISQNISGNLGRFFSYNITLWIISGALGYFAMKSVRLKAYDLTYRILRFRNEWHYIFSGEILDTPELRISKTLKNQTFVAVMVSLEGKSVVYSGLLSNYVLSKEGVFEFLVLKQTKRHIVNLSQKKNNSSDEGFPMPNDISVIPYERIENINITYYDVIKRETYASNEREEEDTNKETQLN